MDLVKILVLLFLTLGLVVKLLPKDINVEAVEKKRRWILPLLIILFLVQFISLGVNNG